jgi:hypothetical protein
VPGRAGKAAAGGVLDTAGVSTAAAQHWWQDRQKRTRAVLVVFAVLALAGILFPAFTNYLFAGDRRILVVTMEQGVGQERREAVRAVCGSLPGVRPIADKGNPDPRIQGRFPVRFDIKDISNQDYARLTACLNEQPGVRGFLEDGNAT